MILMVKVVCGNVV
ncbi:hypothetical protein M2F95_20780 [Vibrio vulnificus]|nr:hypothetical protein [Vibrio vulnificus]